jgi:hypothetical protein
LRRALALLDAKGIPYSGPDKQSGSNAFNVRLNGNLGKQLEHLMRFRPTRFLNKMNIDDFGRLELRGEKVSVVAVRDAGVQDVAVVKTSTGTMIVEGYPVHNCDNDIEIQTPGWDEALCQYLDRYHEIGMIFPGAGVRPIDRTGYRECMWGVGFCWIVNRMVVADVGMFDTTLGHQEEADYCLRVRMGGWKCAAVPEVSVLHDATASNDPAAIERISRGVINFVNKWTRYFGGKNLNYYSPNVLRWDDWPPNALYLEEWFKLRQPGLNQTPMVVNIEGTEYDLIKVFRLRGFYKGRCI